MMDFWKAWRKFVKAYQDEGKKEIPTILNFFDFEGKRVLEVGAGTGRLALKFAPICSKLYALDKDGETINSLIKNASEDNVLSKIKPIVGESSSLSFPDGFFDAVYSTWTLQSVDNLKESVEEMVRVTKSGGTIINVLSSGEGDETKVKGYLKSDAKKLRENRISKIKEILSEECDVEEKRKVLNFSFPADVEEVYSVLKAITLGNKELSSSAEIKKYLRNLIRKDRLHFTQGASFICGYKKGRFTEKFEIE